MKSADNAAIVIITRAVGDRYSRMDKRMPGEREGS